MRPTKQVQSRILLCRRSAQHFVRIVYDALKVGQHRQPIHLVDNFILRPEKQAAGRSMQQQQGQNQFPYDRAYLYHGFTNSIIHISFRNKLLLAVNDLGRQINACATINVSRHSSTPTQAYARIHPPFFTSPPINSYPPLPNPSSQNYLQRNSFIGTKIEKGERKGKWETQFFKIAQSRTAFYLTLNQKCNY